MSYKSAGLWVGVLLFAAFSQAAENTSNNAALSTVREQIQQKQQEIQDQKKDLASLQTQLKEDEAAIDAANRQLQQSQQKLSSVRDKLRRLEAERQKLEAESRQQNHLLTEQFDEAYRMGQHDYLKLLLNQQDPATLDRILAYYGYINDARLKILKQLDTNRTRLLKNKSAISESSQELKELINTQQKDQKNLQQTQTKREQTAQKINSSLQSDQAQLTKLQEAEKAMLKKIEEERKRLEAERERKRKEALAKARAAAKKAGQSQAAAEKRERARLALTELKGLGKAGKLRWPVQGPLLRKFGEERAGEVRWKGILIEAASGTPVRAAAEGDVVFADWLAGFGNVIVIDHGKGYLTLYGNNAQILKQTGQSVKAGDSIATVGNSGNTGATGVYFEIRRAGAPVNPVSLLSK